MNRLYIDLDQVVDGAVVEVQKEISVVIRTANIVDEDANVQALQLCLKLTPGLWSSCCEVHLDLLDLHSPPAAQLCCYFLQLFFGT